MNRNRGGWAGLPRQAELIPLIPATLQAAGTSAGPGQHSRQVRPRREDGQGQGPSPTPQGRKGWLSAGCMAFSTGCKSEKKFKNLLSAALHSQYIFPCNSAQVTTLGLTAALNPGLFCLRKMYAVW